MVAILVEGGSDKEFFDEICDAYNFPKNKIKYFDFNGKDNIFIISHSNYDDLENDINNLGKIDKVLIVVDADSKKEKHKHRGFQNTENKLNETITNLDFKIPVDYYIMCDENKEGNMESFLLSILDDKQKKCIKKFKECYEYELGDKWAYHTFFY